MIHSIQRLDFAYIDCDEAVLFKGGDPDRKTPIGCFAWLLYDAKKDEYVLIDTGIKDIDAVNKTKKGTAFWHRGEKGMALKEHLDRKNIDIEKIKKVIITHAHYDHISCLPLLKNATVYISEAEYELAVSDSNPFAEYLKEVKEYLVSQRNNKKVVFTCDSHQVTEELYIKSAGGHSAGSQMVKLCNGNKRYLFTGDDIFLQENAAKNIPIGFAVNADNSMEALRYCCRFDGIVLTSHDLKCLESEICLI